MVFLRVQSTSRSDRFWHFSKICWVRGRPLSRADAARKKGIESAPHFQTNAPPPTLHLTVQKGSVPCGPPLRVAHSDAIHLSKIAVFSHF